MGKRVSVLEQWKALPGDWRLFALLVAVAGALNLLFGLCHYPVIGHDAYVHLNWLGQFSALREHGLFYPRWLPASFGGFGAPTFYFYPPLPYWLASFYYSLTSLAPENLYHAVQLTASVLSCATAFLFFQRRCELSPSQAWLGAFVYALLSYRFCDVYIRNALGEHVGLIFLPLVLTPFAGVKLIAIRTLAWSGILLSSIPVSLIAALALVLHRSTRTGKEVIIPEGASLLLGILTASMYLVPAILLKDAIHSEHLHDLPLNTSPYGHALQDLVSGHYDWLRILSAGTWLVGAVVLVSGWRTPALRAWRYILLVSVLLQIPLLSDLVWKCVPGLSYIQFSWRFNGLILLILGALTRSMMPARCGVIALALVTILAELTIGRNFFHRPPLPINEYRMDAPEYAPKWTSSDPYAVIGLTQRRMLEPALVPLGLTDPADRITGRLQSPTFWRFDIDIRDSTPVRFHMHYWPLWKAEAGGKSLALVSDANGFATAILPAGKYELDLRLTQSDAERAGVLLSIIGAATLTLLLGLATIQSLKRT